MNEMTIAGFIRRLQHYSPDTLCCGTFWLADDFVSIDSTLTPEEIEAAMELATGRHDAGIGYNWDYLTSIVEDIVSER
ncbi:Uncharacterised protein [Serratia entomophila]|nr:hypothetical protein 345p2_00089 [Serratia entomophila]ULG18112.1 hypothetical protein LCp2_00010 [Serratia proteamaculans]ULG19093.1 hypothetical protein Sm1ap1_00066 [Serratia proteamaculans]CAI1184258.1 Uncharacterised protein [Serratia entomophila]CAI2154019.1 Uncharacterised protein [Serratia entomophila]